MRYFECLINSNEETIKKNEKVRLKDIDYDSVIGAVNKYLHTNLSNDIQFFIYREVDNTCRAVFMYCETKVSYDVAVSEIKDLLIKVADIKMTAAIPEDITIYHFFDCLLEAKRHHYLIPFHNYMNNTNEFIYQTIVDYEFNKNVGFELEERILDTEKNIENNMYDKSLIDEIHNIESYKGVDGIEGNIVHYIISSKGMKASSDMSETLLNSLVKSGRISSRRMELVSSLDPEVYNRDCLEKLINGNLGGAIVIDLSVKFGHSELEYGLCAKFLANLVKKYKNDCLFIFTYDMDNPGFTFKLIPMINHLVGIVKIREANGTREEAIKYLESIVSNSEYSKFSNQVEEFFEKCSGTRFTQTDVLEAYERFEPWCINRNSNGLYNVNLDEDFRIDRDEDSDTSSEKLNKLIGLQNVKKQIQKIIDTNTVERERMLRIDKNYVPSSMHMIFSGNPGTAKTTVAKLFAGIAKEKNIIKSGSFVERNGAEYNSLMPKLIVRQDFEAAQGGVLFIDEAYAIDTDDAITMILQELEAKREEVIVVFAGYNDKMEEFLEKNEGLKSRIPYWVNFPDYDVKGLMDILKLIAEEKNFKLTEDALLEAEIIFEGARLMDNFGNGRYVRNFVEKAIQNQSSRLISEYSNIEDAPKDVLFTIEAIDIANLDEASKSVRKAGEAQKELDEMIGIETAKNLIRKAVATFKMKKIYVEKGLSKDRPSMHMVFTGNPGTAKTTTARLVAEILRDEKVLPSGKFMELGRADLIGKHVGETAPLVKKRFREARGGVLFIDEAYSLCDNAKNSFGDEAISTIVQEMENHREDVIVIFAGYPDEMKEFLDRNLGMASRIAFNVNFEDYSTDELCDIAQLMLKNKNFKITDEGMTKLRLACENARKNSDYGNGRYVRRLIEEAGMNLAQRINDMDSDELDEELITTIEACDICDTDEVPEVHFKMGFQVI